MYVYKFIINQEMKNKIKNSITILIVAIALSSCTKDNNNVDTGAGSLKIQFENGFADNGLVIGGPTVATSNNEILKISKIKYLVSNIVLTKDDGTLFVYPKEQSYFIVDDATLASLHINLSNVPIGNYKKITFGIGVDKEQYDLGELGQGTIWTQAQTDGMTMSGTWMGGYKCIDFEGTFSSPTVISDASFMVQNGKSGMDYNYAEISLDLPTNALVRSNIIPEIHMSTDLSQIIDGTNKISLTTIKGSGSHAMIMGGSTLPLITENITEMFAIEHVHNDPN